MKKQRKGSSCFRAHSVLHFRDHPGGEDYEKAISRECFVLLFVNESLAKYSERAGYGC